MSETHSNAPAKPNKPYPEYPLTAHPAGYWCKKIRGKLHYFGKWDDPDGALKKYLAEKDALHAGRVPRPDAEAMTVKDMCNQFLNAKQAAVDAGELSPRTHVGYREACEEIVSGFGKRRLGSDLGPQDFAGLRDRLAKKYGPHRLGATIQCIRSVFKYGFDNELIERAVRFGAGFKRPTRKTLRLHHAEQGVRLFSREEIRRMLAGVQLKAMILLGINCGFGNADCGNLPKTAVDLDGGWIDYPRPKTGIPRRCALWPEAVESLRGVLASRKELKDEADPGLVFVTKYGMRWAKDSNARPLSRETGKLLKRLGINGRKGLGFYTLRHTFRTVADETKDSVACDFVTGHETPHMSSVYRKRIADERLKAVTDHVRAWLFDGVKAEAKPTSKSDEEEKGRIEATGTAG
jgi:integrase